MAPNESNLLRNSSKSNKNNNNSKNGNKHILSTSGRRASNDDEENVLRELRYNSSCDDDDASELISIASSAKSKNSMLSLSDPANLAQEEMKNVIRAKAQTFTLFVVIALTASITLAILLAAHETNHFVEDWEHDVSTLYQTTGKRFVQTIEAMASLGTLYTTTLATTKTWATIDQFAFRGGAAVKLSYLQQIYTCPLVLSNDDEQWNIFVEQQQQQQMQPTQQDSSISSVIYEYNDANLPTLADPSKTQYYPIWQMAPAVKPSLNNFDMQTVNPTLFDQVAMTSQISWSLMNASSIFATQNNQDVQQVETAEPVSLVALPLLDQFGGTNVVGAMIGQLYWTQLLQNIFPANVQGMLVVLSSECFDTVTFEVSHDKVKFLGFGDMHNPYYNEYEYSRTILSLLKEQGFTSTLDGISINDSTSSCNDFSIQLYPSARYQNTHVNNSAVVFTGVVMVIFTVAWFMLLIYSGYIETQFHNLRHKAAHTSKIVNTLFPKKVQDRMFQLKQAEEFTKNNSFNNGVDEDPLAKIKTFLQQAKKDTDDTPPIADLFPACTVMFADIAGFTAWSSKREPVDVFTLLETIYKAFDKIAEKRKVFKVETIGDCYMCVTGLPTARDDHAVVMCRFAADCLRKMKKLLKNELLEKLGENTSVLGFRVGLHSGPVTAGVLRGEKSRFQLFGDTVNTAARMESTGKRDLVQISKTTATELFDFGKSHWTEPRKGGVEAKGKGVLETYWLRPHAVHQNLSSNSSTGHSTNSKSSQSDNDDVDDVDNDNDHDDLVQTSITVQTISIPSSSPSDNDDDFNDRTMTMMGMDSDGEEEGEVNEPSN